MKRLNEDTHALGKIGLVILIVLLVGVAVVGGNAAYPYAGDQKVAAGDYLEYRYSYTMDNETWTVDVKYTFTAVTTDDAIVNVVYNDGEDDYDFNMTVDFLSTDPLELDWPDSPDNAFDIFDFMYIMDEADVESSFAFQNVGVNIVLMDSYNITDTTIVPYWNTSASFDADYINLDVKMGTHVPIYMEMYVDTWEYTMTAELTSSSIGWVTLI